MNCWTAARIFIMSALICSTTADTKGEDDVCKTADCMRLGLELSDAINASADPCDDFYDYVCKKWKNKTQIPPYLPSYGHLWLIRDEVAKKINETLRGKAIKRENQTFEDKIVMAYKSCMKGANELHELNSTLNTFGIKQWPMMLNSTETINWTDIYRKIRIEGDMSFIFSINLKPYFHNTSQRAISIERYEMVPSPDFSNNDTLEAYKKFITQTIILFSGMPTNVATEIAQNILDFQANITKKLYYDFKPPVFTISSGDLEGYLAYYGSEEPTDVVVKLDDLSGLPDLGNFRLSDENIDNGYEYFHPEESSSSSGLDATEISETTSQPSRKLKDINEVLKKLIKDIFQDASVNLTEEDKVNVPEPLFLTHAMDLLNSTSAATVNNYFGWMLLYKLGPIASHNMTKLNFEFNQVWRGLQGEEPRWRHCVNALNDPYDPILGYGLGRLYVDKYFNETEKEDVETIAKNVSEALKIVLQNNTWMDNATKANATKKLEHMVFKLGYPEEIKNDTFLNDMYKDVGNVTLNGSFLSTYLNFRNSNAKYKFKKMGSVFFNRTKEWPHDWTKVNADYSLLENSVVLAAVILQHPFYSFGLPSSVKMGTFGWIIGHELNHAFYGPGSNFDEYGNKSDWWSTDAINNFTIRGKCVKDLYKGQIEEETCLTVNENETLNENIADIKGLETAFEAHRRLLLQFPNVTQRLPCLNESNPDKLFFISLGYSFCQNDQLAELRDIVLRDPHTSSKIRVNRHLGNSKSFLETFQCKAGSRMNIGGKCEV
uniref:Putative peptidase family m13 includes neprilysin and endothelin-converting enzyme i n=1 Tax=Ixodes ricinus TaxID=34613 RepID=A0A6B0VDX3_IXORI